MGDRELCVCAPGFHSPPPFFFFAFLQSTHLRSPFVDARKQIYGDTVIIGRLTLYYETESTLVLRKVIEPRHNPGALLSFGGGGLMFRGLWS